MCHAPTGAPGDMHGAYSSRCSRRSTPRGLLREQYGILLTYEESNHTNCTGVWPWCVWLLACKSVGDHAVIGLVACWCDYDCRILANLEIAVVAHTPKSDILL